MAPEESLWQAGAGPRGITSGTFYARFRRYLAAAGLAPTGLHVLRHTAAKLRREAGESVEQVSAFLDHSSLAVTTVYLRRLEGEADRAWAQVAAAIGLSNPAGSANLARHGPARPPLAISRSLHRPGCASRPAPPRAGSCRPRGGRGSRRDGRPPAGACPRVSRGRATTFAVCCGLRTAGRRMVLAVGSRSRGSSGHQPVRGR